MILNLSIKSSSSVYKSIQIKPYIKSIRSDYKFLSKRTFCSMTFTSTSLAFKTRLTKVSFENFEGHRWSPKLAELKKNALVSSSTKRKPPSAFSNFQSQLIFFALATTIEITNQQSAQIRIKIFELQI